MTRHRIERRQCDRIAAGPVPSIRVRPGCPARVVDVSAGGALLETDRGLPPGALVELQMDFETRRCIVRGRVLRCAVAELRASAVKYRSAIAFDHSLAWLVPRPPHSIAGPAAGESREERTAAADALL
jgi:PilZ domain-containing protein